MSVLDDIHNFSLPRSWGAALSAFDVYVSGFWSRGFSTYLQLQIGKHNESLVERL